MNMLDFLNKCDPEKMSFQILSECVDGAVAARRGLTKVTFTTTEMAPVDLVSTPSKVCVIIWVPREEAERVSKL